MGPANAVSASAMDGGSAGATPQDGPTPQDAPISATRPVVEVVAAPIVNYAMAHGGIAFLHRVVVTVPPTAPDADDLVVHAEVVGAHGDVLTRPWQHHVDSLRAGIPLVVDHPAIRLDARHLADLEEETTAEVVVTVTTDGRELAAHTPPSGCSPPGSGPSTRPPRSCRWSCSPRSSSPTIRR
ncbi:MAG: hypothetical protein ABJA74_14020 [Lapillicoccus sp.]